MIKIMAMDLENDLEKNFSPEDFLYISDMIDILAEKNPTKEETEIKRIIINVIKLRNASLLCPLSSFITALIDVAESKNAHACPCIDA